MRSQTVPSEVKSIGVYMPRWLYRSDTSDRMFFDELLQTIHESGRYRALPLDLPSMRLGSDVDAKTFCDQHNLVLVLQHDSNLYSSLKRYGNTVNFLEPHVRFVNSKASQEIGHDKRTTKALLKERGIPVLEDAVIDSSLGLSNHLELEKWYVVKPVNKGGGAGVRLIRKTGAKLFGHHRGAWRSLSVLESGNPNSFTLKHPLAPSQITVLVFLALVAITIPLVMSTLWALSILIGIGAFLFFIHIYDRGFTYMPMLVEPYFNDDPDGFSSLRCTVIGDEVVEAVKRTNRRNITSNVSSGGKAQKIELTVRQKEIAIAAKNAIGADYAGVDMLECRGETIVGEVNIGPFTLFCTYTGVNVGKILGEYLIRTCDERAVLPRHT